MTVAWTPDHRAEVMLRRRQELIMRLPRAVTAARQLSEDEHELIVDESLTHVVVEYDGPITSAKEAEQVFWATANWRVARYLEGRNATVRGSFERVKPEDANDVPEDFADPAEIAQQAEELQLAVEFTATLDELEGQVVRVKWLSSGSEPLGYRKVAAALGISPARARQAERSIATKLDRFATFLAAGRLCVERKTQITALATAAEADRRSAAVAKAHIKHCAVCKADYVAQLRAVRSAAFQREVASLIPALPIAESARRDSGPLRDIIADWLSRPFGQDAVVSAGQAASTGIGRGAGGVVAAKIAAVLAAGAATVAITTSVTNDTESRAVPTPTPAATTPTPTATPSPSPTPTATPSPKPTPRPKAKKKQATSAKTQGGTSPTSHEEAPSSAAPQGSLPNGGSEFSPDGASLPPAAPAPVPAAPGSSEFP